MKELHTSNDAWAYFCISKGSNSYIYGGRTYESDYQACLRSAQGGEPNAVALMTEFAKFRMTS